MEAGGFNFLEIVLASVSLFWVIFCAEWDDGRDRLPLMFIEDISGLQKLTFVSSLSKRLAKLGLLSWVLLVIVKCGQENTECWS